MNTKEQFRAGAAQVEITPSLGTRMNGDFITHYATSIHDSLFSKALVVDDGKTCIAIIIVDICAMQRDFLDPIKIEIEKRLGIYRNNILIASTHAHSAGSVTDLLLGGVDFMYRRQLPALIIESAVKAFGNLKPAVLGFCKVSAPEHVLCRRYFMKPDYKATNPVNDHLDLVKTNPIGDEAYIERRVSTVDDELSCLVFKGEDDEYISVLANYSLHYVGDFDSGTISADYFGYFARHLSDFLGNPKGFVGMMSNGTSGEANIWDFMDPERHLKEAFERSDSIGHSLAEKVYTSLKTISWQQNPILSVRYQDIKLKIRKPSEEELSRATELVSNADFTTVVPDYNGLKMIYAREQVLLHDYPDYTYQPIQSIKLGDITIGAIGAEMFAETGLALKNAMSNGHYFTICLANDYIGYIPPEHEFSLGGYETWRCRTSQLVVDAEAEIRNRLINMNANSYQ